MLETQDLKDFCLRSWYPLFKQCVLKCVIINIPSELIEKFRSRLTDSEIRSFCTIEYINQINNVIKSFPESVAFVKNNWHAPLDSKFMSLGNLLKVTDANDLLLYLSVSETVCKDFDTDKFNDFCIILKPWINIHPASEFRCIVINNTLRGFNHFADQGITNRDWPTFYNHYADEGPGIIETISNFYLNEIMPRFKRTNYTFDIIINYPDNEITIIDFGPLNAKSNLYAFTWKEIHDIIKKNSNIEVPPVFRYLENDMGIMTKGEALLKISRSEASHQ